MNIKDERKINKPFLSKAIISEFKKDNIEFKYNPQYDWYNIYLVRHWCYGMLSYSERIGTVYSSDTYYGSYLSPFYFRIHKYHDLVTQLASKIPELSKITFLLKDN